MPALGHLAAVLAVLAITWPALVLADPAAATAALIAATVAALILSAPYRHRRTT